MIQITDTLFRSRYLKNVQRSPNDWGCFFFMTQNIVLEIEVYFSIFKKENTNLTKI
jgi:hypothetical protein